MTFKIKQKDMYIIGYICFLTAFVISASQLSVAYSSLYVLRKIFRILGYGFCLYKILSIQLTPKRFWVIAFFMGAIIVSRFLTRMDTLFVDFVLIATVQGVDRNRIIKADMIFRIVTFIILFLSVRLGIVNDYVGYRNGELIRASLGFNHPNRMGQHLMIACLDVFYLYHANFKKWHYSFIICCALIVKLVADSRAPFICIILALLIEIYCELSKKFKIKKCGDSIVKLVCNATLVGCCLLSYLLTYLYLNGIIFVSGGNDTIGSRIIKASNALNQYGVSLLGKRITYIGIEEAFATGQQANGIDNLYVYIPVNFGIIFGVSALLLCFATINYLTKTHNYPALACFMILIIFSLVENTVVKIECNVFLIFLAESVLNNHSRYQLENKDKKLSKFRDLNT